MKNYISKKAMLKYCCTFLKLYKEKTFIFCIFKNQTCIFFSCLIFLVGYRYLHDTKNIMKLKLNDKNWLNGSPEHFALYLLVSFSCTAAICIFYVLEDRYKWKPSNSIFEEYRISTLKISFVSSLLKVFVCLFVCLIHHIKQYVLK